MKTIVKITFVCIAVLAFNLVNAQNALTKRSIKQAETKSFVKAQPFANETSVQQEQISTTIKTQPASVKNISSTQAKTSAQMSSKPLQKKMVVQQKAGAEPKSVK